MRLYHRTPAMDSILKKGFRDNESTFLTTGDQCFSGVWFSDRPLDSNEGAKGKDLLAVDIPECVVSEYEWENEGGTYREFLIPAALANQYRPPVIIQEDED